MKIVTVIAVVCYLFVVNNCLTTPSSPRPALDVLKNCSSENNVQPLIADKLVKHTQVASKRNEKCFLSCFLKGRGYYVNGNIHADKILQYLKTSLTAEKYKKLQGTFERCVSKVNKAQDKCEVANEVYRCVE